MAAGAAHVTGRSGHQNGLCRRSHRIHPYWSCWLACVSVRVVVASGTLSQRMGASGDVVGQHGATSGQHILQRAQPVSVCMGSGRVGDDVEAGDDVRFDGKHRVGVVHPRI